MNLRPVVAAGLLLCSASAFAQDTGLLVSPKEALDYQGALGYEQFGEVRLRGAAPAIEIVTPSAAGDQKLKSPFAIAVRFQPLPDAAIVPATFRVLYGALKLDITSRITKFVQVTPAGFSFDRAQIPAGRHKLTLQVEDDKQRVAERELRFEIE